MKKLLLLLSICMPIQPLHAQIAIDSSDFRSWAPHVDTNCDISFGSIPPTQNVVADYTGGFYGNVWLYAAYADTAAQFPLASYHTSFNYLYPTISSSQHSWSASIWSGITPDGVLDFGESASRQPLSTTARTGGINDSVIILEQKMIYSTPKSVVKFPLSYGVTWTNNYFKTTDIIINIPAAGLNNKQFTRKSYTIETDSVVGWGKMRIKNLYSQGSDYMEVLILSARARYLDTLYLNGAPITDSIAQIIHIPKTDSSASTYLSWYRKGHVMPLYRSFSYGVLHQEVCMNDLLMPIMPSAVAMTANDDDLKIFPNPVKNGNPLFLEFQSASPTATYTYELINSMGQSVSKAQLNTGSKRTEINVGNTNATGNYFLRLHRNDKVITTRQIIIEH